MARRPGAASAAADSATAEPVAKRLTDRSAGLLAFALTLVALAWASDLPARFGYGLYTEQFLAVVLALSLGLVFLSRPSRLPMVDRMLAAAGLAGGLWIAFDYPRLVAEQMNLPVEGLALAVVMLVLVLEGLRRTTGWMLVVVVLTILALGLLGHQIPGDLQTRFVAPERLLIYLGFDANGLFGLTLMVAATVVIAFVFFGQLLLKSGGADFFNDIAMGLMGRRRGGSAKIAVVASGLFGSISGVVVSNIVATGVVTIRMMTRSGYKRHQAAAIEAVASTGGQIVPPVMGAVAFLMADILQKPYSDVVIAAIIPAVLYYLAVFVQVDLQAARDGIAVVDGEEIPKTRSVAGRGWVFILPFAAIVAALFWFGQRPETAALWGCAVALAVGLLKGYHNRMTLTAILGAVTDTGRSVIDIVMIAAAAGFIIGVLNITGLGFALTFSLVALGGSNLLLLLLIAAAVCLVLGMGMPTVGVYLLLAVLIAPSLVQSGVEPIAAHLFIFYLGMMSMVTPPVGIGAFFAASIADARPMQTAVTAMRYGWSAYIVPFLFVLSPTLLMIGEPGDIFWSVAAAAAGVYLISAASVGWIAGSPEPLRRIGFLLAGALLLYPQTEPQGLVVNALGLLFGIAVYVAGSFWRPAGRLTPGASGAALPRARKRP
ncbi:TRAP transporter permease [Algihabitans albus]|uniref:TRAP transporter permease n=1 Tax=Algihabitans albus TaxID=2164067 RepID=UPI000E5D30C9|nr:TRAP transporter fused permease subunit [Algihabitans albus]